MADALVIIPTYNEIENISNIIDAVISQPETFDVLIIDDGSPDGTASVVREKMKQYDGRVFLEERKGKLGLGTAYIHGFKWAKRHGYEYVIEMDADFSHNPNDLPKLYKACKEEGADLSIGSRYISGVNVVNWPMGRVLMSYYASAYVRIVTGMNVRDTTAGFVCYKRRVLDTLDLDKIEFKGVGFSYDDGHDILKDVNITIPKGKMIALVGQSGSGKSTLVDLIPRYHDVCSGQITLDGTDIRDFRIKDLRSLIGNVNQEAILFNDTIFNNIAFGVEGATMEQVIAAAKIANAHDFIMDKEEGYQTNIGDRGAKLSGGQRQRISIARAILKNPPILILDEATSALDTESEKLVQEALDRLTGSRTTIAIAHRLSTIKNADEICVMHEGRIVERGKHEELLALNGYYKRLNDMQAL